MTFLRMFNRTLTKFAKVAVEWMSEGGWWVESSNWRNRESSKSGALLKVTAEVPVFLSSAIISKASLNEPDMSAL